MLYDQQVSKYCTHVKNGYMIPEMSYYSTMPDNVGLDLYSDSNLTVWDTQGIFTRHWFPIYKADNGSIIIIHDHVYYAFVVFPSLQITVYVKKVMKICTMLRSTVGEIKAILQNSIIAIQLLIAAIYAILPICLM